ncbi:MAG: hypothetical protein V4670_09465 [Bacteroidota bacterium]
MKVIKKYKNKIKKILVKGKLLLYYCNKISFSNQPKKKQIVIVFDGKIQHGGLVDRLKGIVSFYQIAKEVNADFKIYFKHPFELNLFLETNQFNWNATEDDLKWNPINTKILYLMDDFKINPKESISKSNKKKFIVYANIDYSVTIHEALDLNEQNDLWRISFNELFKKSNYLETALSSIVANNNTIAIHTRFTSILGDFKDTTKREVSDQRKIAIIEALKISILEIAKEYPEKEICVFSDSIRFLNEIKLNTPYKVLDGIPKHIDFDKKKQNVIEEHQKTFTDFFAIAESEKVFLLKTKEMYNSAFGKYAAIVGNCDFNIVSI